MPQDMLSIRVLFCSSHQYCKTTFMLSWCIPPTQLSCVMTPQVWRRLPAYITSAPATPLHWACGHGPDSRQTTLPQLHSLPSTCCYTQQPPASSLQHVKSYVKSYACMIQRYSWCTAPRLQKQKKRFWREPCCDHTSFIFPTDLYCTYTPTHMHLDNGMPCGRTDTKSASPHDRRLTSEKKAGKLHFCSLQAE